MAAHLSFKELKDTFEDRIQEFRRKLDELRHLENGLEGECDDHMRTEIEHCVELLHQDVNQLIQVQTDLHSKVQHQQQQIEYLEEQKANLINKLETIQSDTEQQRAERDHTRELLQAAEGECEQNMQRQHLLDEENKYYETLKEMYQEKEIQFHTLYQQCQNINYLNSQLAQRLQELEKENATLEKECQELQNLDENQKEYAAKLRLQNEKTEEVISQLELYQKQIKRIIQEQNEHRIRRPVRFDPLKHIEHVTSKQLSLEEQPHEPFQDEVQSASSSYSSTGSSSSSEESKSTYQPIYSEQPLDTSVSEEEHKPPKPKDWLPIAAIGLGLLLIAIVGKRAKLLKFMF